MANDSETVSCGLDLPLSSNIGEDLNNSLRDGFHFICVTLNQSRIQDDVTNTSKMTSPLARTDFLFSNNKRTRRIVGSTSTSLNLDAKEEIVRAKAESAFHQEISFANHLNLPAVIIELNGSNCANLARNINICASNAHCNSLWIKVPMNDPGAILDDNLDEARREDPWQWWNKLRTLCGFNKKLCILLEITEDLPEEKEIERWLAEPVKAVLISTDLFLTNGKGFPVLTKSHQKLLNRLFEFDVQFVITGEGRHKDNGYVYYKLYLDHLYRNRKSLDEVAQFVQGYEDYLQCPLQPLKDNLESQTYEIFETDPVKYVKYQMAMNAALLDRVKEEDKDKVTVTLMVLGAGRGPLVRAALQAAAAADRLVKVYAVEKNPNAVITLENLKNDIWGDQVTIVSCDMRFWQPEEKADIIVSELLGSFGDNELSPECLDGAERFLKDDGISIPCSYTSYLAPLHSSKLWNEAKMCAEIGKPVDAHFETPYVVRLHNCLNISKPQPLFTFHHPRSLYDSEGGFVSNNRYAELAFKVDRDTVMHGFSGYFHCTLYKDITISIEPETHTPRMFSWFPIYFPLRTPQSLKDGEELVVNFWRVNDNKNVWYEWCVSSPRATLIHNTGGRSYTIAL